MGAWGFAGVRHSAYRLDISPDTAGMPVQDPDSEDGVLLVGCILSNHRRRRKADLMNRVHCPRCLLGGVWTTSQGQGSLEDWRPVLEIQALPWLARPISRNFQSQTMKTKASFVGLSSDSNPRKDTSVPTNAQRAKI